MAENLDLEALLAPIPGDNPTGVDLREDPTPDSLYHQVKDARNSARSAERASLAAEGDAPDNAKSDWKKVLELAPRILAEQSKDLEIAAWLIESLIRLKGYSGLRDGFELTRELIAKYWDDLYPKPDDEGIEARVYPISGLNGDGGNGTLITPIHVVPLSQSKDLGPFGYADFAQALEVERITDPDKRQRRLDGGAISRESFDRAMRTTDPAILMATRESIEACQVEYGKLVAILSEKCGRDAPPSSAIREALENVHDTIVLYAKQETQPAESEVASTDSAPTTTAASSVSVQAGSIQNREHALEVLLRVADFFRRTEPHTPVSYALEQAVRWGRLPLPQLLEELINDEASRNAVFKQVGISLPTAESN